MAWECNKSMLTHTRRPRGGQSGGRKGATKVFKHRRKSPLVPTLTGPFPNGHVNVDSWLGKKNALYYCAQSANSIPWVLFASSYTTAIISPHLPGSFTKLSYSETKELPMSRKTFGCYQQEPFNLHWENYVSDGSQCIVSNRMFRMQRRRESKKSNSLTRENNDFARAASQSFVHFLCRHCTTTTWKCLMSRFMKDLNKQYQNFLSLYELGYGWQKFSSRRVRLHLTK